MRYFAVTAAMLCYSASLFAQQVNTLYFMNNVPERNAYNPAFQPVHNVYIDLLVMPNFRFDAGNSSLGFNDIIFSQKINGRDSTITFLHPQALGKKDDFYSSLSKTTRIYGDLTFNLIGFGFRVKKNYFTVDVSEKVSVGAYLPKDLFKLALYGAGKGPGGYSDVFDLSRLGVQASAYTEFGLGYSRKINDKLTVGGKLKYLIGQANINTDIEDFKLTASADRWAISGRGTINASLPLVDIPFGADGLIDIANLKPEVNTESLNSVKGITDLFFSSNNGFGVDLGATYNILPELQLSAALTDLGFIRWRSNLTNANLNTEFATEGVTYELGDKIEDKLDTLLQNFKDAFVSSGTHSSYTTALSTRLNVGAEYSVVKNKIGFGLLSSTLYANKSLYTDLMVAANLRPSTWFSASFTYSLLNGRLSTVGFGAQVRVAPFNMYLAVDRIPLAFASSKMPIPQNLTGFNLQAGMVWVIGDPRKTGGDDDGDGVKNSKDKCPNTPQGYMVDKYGCVIDTDGDGVPDNLDKCPATAFGVAVDSAGCPLDSDGDGIPDYQDRCPGTPAAALGKVDTAGCPTDTDGDGIADYEDNCPTIVGVGSNYGCPEITAAAKQILKKARTGIQFSLGGESILPNSYAILNQIAEVMSENSDYILLINGHTDNIGNSYANLLLSERRAGVVKAYLKKEGIQDDRMIAKGFGDTKPVESNSTEEGRAKNRRVEFIVKFEQ
ncbi:MAG: DUF5723 family protein [Prevotellaceae bacterium]|nr:DUF5723 family protein [Prevotellaceae bacterium]